MRNPSQTSVRSGDSPGEATHPGLFRREVLGTEPALSMSNLFADLRRLNRGEIIAEHPERHLQGTRLLVDRSHGHGFWELYRLDQDLYVVAVDGFYDVAHVETVPGEGLVEFCIRLSGVLELSLPAGAGQVRVVGPRLLIWYQPPGVTITESLKSKVRDTGVSLYCKLPFLAELARRNGINHWPLLEQIQNHPGTSVFHRQFELSPTLLYVAKSLLECPYRRGIRVLHAEAKALELLCEVLSQAQQPQAMSSASPTSEGESRRLDAARHLLTTQLSTPPRLADIARAVGMSESKLKRTFKARFGATVFDYGLESRMRHALELLRCRRMSVGQVAYAVGYRHQTSFTSAFFQFFGFLPSKARTDMH
jgi:AraC-like DNA-binding protein